MFWPFLYCQSLYSHKHCLFSGRYADASQKRQKSTPAHFWKYYTSLRAIVVAFSYLVGTYWCFLAYTMIFLMIDLLSVYVTLMGLNEYFLLFHGWKYIWTLLTTSSNCYISLFMKHVFSFIAEEGKRKLIIFECAFIAWCHLWLQNLQKISLTIRASNMFYSARLRLCMFLIITASKIDIGTFRMKKCVKIAQSYGRLTLVKSVRVELANILTFLPENVQKFGWRVLEGDWFSI